ncbi:MAG: hypothetical protein IPJ58_03205 [Ardenticatenia bacterium]|nr:hypothetical protein [Ardenticatenia bacterium]
MSLSFGRFRQRRRRNLAIVTGIMCLIAAALVWSSAPARRGAEPPATAQPSPRMPAASATAGTPTPRLPPVPGRIGFRARRRVQYASPRRF